MSVTRQCNLVDLQHQAQMLATRLTPTSCVLLQGPLGAGKTTFAQALIRALAPEAEVTSPTFTLVHNYPVILNKGQRVMLYHADLYRVNHWHELEEIGITEWLELSPCIIEWPEKLGPYMPTSRIEVTLSIAADDRREITIHEENCV